MKGSNTLILDQAEMIRAVEYYLNNVQFKEPVHVSIVNQNPGETIFYVILEEPVENLDKTPAA